MANSPIIRIETSDSDLLFRQKCNQNFQEIARNSTKKSEVLQVVGDSEVVSEIILAMGDKASQQELTQLSSNLTALIAEKIDKGKLLAGPGIGITVTSDTVTIKALCPVPVNGIYFHVGTFTPSALGWDGTTWEAVDQTALSAQAWKRLT